MAAPTITRTRPKDLLAQMAGGALYRRAYERGMNLSTFLEREDPTDSYAQGDPGFALDAFGRMMRAAEIITRSDPDRGFYCDKFEAFDKDDSTRALVPEWMARCWRRAQTGRDVSTRALYTAADQIPGSSVFPFFTEPVPRYAQIAPAVPLSEMVAITTPIDADTYRAFYLTDITAQARRVRVAEGAEMPRAKLSGGDHSIKLHKYGRVLEVTYEVLRRMQIDLVALHIMRLATQNESDKVDAGLDVLINGDGNSNSATVYNLTTLDPAASAGTLTLKGWLALKLQYFPNYHMSTLLAQSVPILSTQLLNTGSANIPLVNIAAGSNFGGFRPINPQLGDEVAYGVTAAAPTLKLVTFDRRLALQQITEVGSDISEIERWATRQTQAIAMSEVQGFAIIDQKATRILDINA